MNRFVHASAILTFLSAAVADVPRQINYQGKLTGVTGPVDLTVTFYDSADGQNVLFTETHDEVSLSGGVFAILIGKPSGGVTDSALDAEEVWLGLTVDEDQGGQELSPRTRLIMVPYAAKADAAERLVIPDTFGNAVTVDSEGDVGIGTTTPNDTLHVMGHITVESPNPNLTLKSTSGGHQYEWYADFSGPGSGDLALYDRTVNSVPFLVSPSGNVGIGTTIPWTPLNVAGESSPSQVYREDPVLLLSKASGSRVADEGPSLGFNSGGAFLYGAIKGAATNSQVDQHGGYLSFYTTTVGSGHGERMRIDENGGVGIGTTVPATNLHVVGCLAEQLHLGHCNYPDRFLFEGIHSSGYARIGGFDNQTGPVDLVLQDSGGNVGIGTTTPESRLHVQGGIRARGGPPGPDQSNNNGYMFVGVNNGGGDEDSGMSSSADGQIEFYSNSIERMRIRSDGNVGIGTQSPNAPVVVVNNGTATNGVKLELEREGVGDVALSLHQIGVGSSAIVSPAGTSDLAFFTDRYYGGAGDERMRIRADGNVGIGTTAPSATLHLARDIGDTSLLLTNDFDNQYDQHIHFEDTESDWYLGNLWISENPNGFGIGRSSEKRDFVIDPNGKVGIGTTTPQANLDVLGTEIVNEIGTGYIQLNARFDSMIDMVQADGSVKRPLSIHAAQTFNGALIDVFRYENGGYVPKFSVQADGTTRVNILEINGGADLAEMFDVKGGDEASRAIEPGMVVSIDSAHPGDLMLASEPYDRKVAGVISGANGLSPGMILQAEGNAMASGAYAVALSGRVWVWCDASYDPIQPGDRLTTSATFGHAMKVSNGNLADGAVIGKAMTLLTEGRGLVLLLVQPQ